MKKYIISEDVLNQVLNYLGSKPYIESAKHIDSIRNGVTEYIEPNTKSEEQFSE